MGWHPGGDLPTLHPTTTPPRVAAPQRRPGAADVRKEGTHLELTPRVPPHSTDAEISVLGSILLDNDTLNTLGDSVAPDMFYREGHRKIFTLSLIHI